MTHLWSAHKSMRVGRRLPHFLLVTLTIFSAGDLAANGIAAINASAIQSTRLANRPQSKSGQTVAVAPKSGVPSPRDVIGFTPGDDRKLAAWSQIVDYFKRLDRASNRVKFEELGKTTLGRPFVLATISSERCLTQLFELNAIARAIEALKVVNYLRIWPGSIASKRSNAS